MKIHFQKINLLFYLALTSYLTGCVGNSSSSSNPTPTTTKAYVTSKNGTDGVFQECQINSDGSISNCIISDNEHLQDPEGIAIYFDPVAVKPYMFISNISHNSISVCDLNVDGSINECRDTQVTHVNHPEELLVANIEGNNFLFIGNEDSLGVTRCKIGAEANLSDCSNLVTSSTIHATTGLKLLNNWDQTTDLHHHYLYMTTANSEQQILRCDIDKEGIANDCSSQAQDELNTLNPDTIDGITTNGEYMYLTAKASNMLLICHINQDGTISGCITNPNSIPGPFEIAFNNNGQSNDGTPIVKAYITSTTTHTIYTCEVNANSGVLDNCNPTDEVNVTAPREIITSMEAGNLEEVIDPQYYQTSVIQTQNHTIAGFLPIEAFGRLLFSPQCGTYLTLSNKSRDPITVSFLKTQVSIGANQSHRFYYSTDDHFQTSGTIKHQDGKVENFEYLLHKSSVNCLATVKVAGANQVSTPYDLWVADTPTSTITINDVNQELITHRNNYKTAAAGSLLAYNSVFASHTGVNADALNLLKNAGFDDFLEVSSLSPQSSAFNTTSYTKDENIIVYQDANSNGIQLVQADGISKASVNIDKQISFNMNGKLLLAYNAQNNTILLAYRGTDNMANWIVNVAADKVPWVTSIPETDSIINQLLLNAKVHFGFYVYEHDLLNHSITQNWLNKHRNLNTAYLVTGHSLGGAAASLASAHLLSSGIADNKVSTITFGQPAAGNNYFAQAYNLKSKYYSRIVNEYDPVGGITAPLDYEHYGFRINLSGMTASTLNTHSMEEYYNASSYYSPL